MSASMAKTLQNRWYVNSAANGGTAWTPYEDYLQGILDSRYMSDRTDIVYFDRAGYTYQLDFAKMQQTNLQTGKCRTVWRTVVLGCDSTSSSASSSSPAAAVRAPTVDRPATMPSLRNSTDFPPGAAGKLDSLGMHDTGFRFVANEFYKTMKSSKHIVHDIYRITNTEQWARFRERKQQMPDTSLERHLFHATSDEISVRGIYNDNFDPSLSGRRYGASYGRGTYFSTTARGSHAYARQSPSSGHRFVFLARVLVGFSARGNASVSRAPTGFHSCVDDTANPQIFVVFDGAQCFPEYLIEYTDASCQPGPSTNRAPIHAPQKQPITITNAAAALDPPTSIRVPQKRPIMSAYDVSLVETPPLSAAKRSRCDDDVTNPGDPNGEIEYLQ